MKPTISGGDIVKNIAALNEKKLNILREILDISLKIKDEAENASSSSNLNSNSSSSSNEDHDSRAEFESQAESDSDNSINNITSLVDFREELVEELKNISLSLKNYAAELRGRDPGVFEKSDDVKIVLDAIKAADEANAVIISGLMAEVKEKVKAVKENRALMDKYAGGEPAAAAGTFLNEKK